MKDILSPIISGIIFNLVMDAFMPILYALIFEHLSTFYFYTMRGELFSATMKVLKTLFIFLYSKLTLFNILGSFFVILILPFIIIVLILKIDLNDPILDTNPLSMSDDDVSENPEEELSDVPADSIVDFPLEEISDSLEYLSFVLVLVILIFES